MTIDPNALNIVNELETYLEADASHDAAAAAQIADLQAQVAALQAEIAAPKEFMHITLTSDPAHVKLEFYNGTVVEQDFPPSGDLSISVDLAPQN
jgi:uncharacterized protein YijF (DUF1287 family)